MLAYSTLSQLGYMFMALGVGAWLAAIFHLMAHGFTKGLLFLGSGSVIHAVHEEQDMTRMGGALAQDPVDALDLPHRRAVAGGHPALRGLLLQGPRSWTSRSCWAGGRSSSSASSWPALTGFYMFRLMGLTFYGKSRVDPEVEPKIHESPPSMVGPLVLLAIPTAFLGLAIGLPLGDSTIKHWLEPVFHPGEVILGITFPEYELIGLNGGLILDLGGHGRAGHRRRHLALRRLQCTRAPGDRSTASRSATA